MRPRVKMANQGRRVHVSKKRRNHELRARLDVFFVSEEEGASDEVVHCMLSNHLDLCILIDS
jgi:hypothetical protein